MKKLNLKRIQVVAGVAYGPGEVEVDERVAKRLKGENLPASAKEDEPEGSPSPDSMTKAQLLEEAERRGLEANEKMTKAEIVAVLEGGGK